LKQELDEEVQKVASLRVTLHDKEEEWIIHQRKTAQSLKDMSKQLQLAQRKQASTSTGNSSTDLTSVCIFIQYITQNCAHF
jgi:hypothetical protein